MEFKNVVIFVAVLCSASNGNLLLSRADSSHEFLLLYTQNATTKSPMASSTQKTQDNTTSFVDEQPTDLKIDETINDLSSNLVSAIISKLEVETKITNLVLDSLTSTGRKKAGVKAIKTRRVLEYISRKISLQIMKITKTSESERSKLIYGLAQTAAETAIISALEDITFATALITQDSPDMSLRRKRSSDKHSSKLYAPALKISDGSSMLTSMIMSSPSMKGDGKIASIASDFAVSHSPIYVMTNREKAPIKFMKGHSENQSKGFMNTSVSDFEMNEITNKSQGILIHGKIKEIAIVSPSDNFDVPKNSDMSKFKVDAAYSDDDIKDVEQDIIEKFEEKKKPVTQVDILDKRAKKALEFCGEVALNTAGSAVALRRSLTAAIEVKMSVIAAKQARASRKSLIVNLAKSAARQAGKEAKIANTKSMASEKAMQEATKLTAMSTGSAFNPAAGRLMISSIGLAAVAKSMAYVASEVAIDALYQVTDVKRT